MYALGKRNQCLLVALFPRVDVNDGLVDLGREDMGSTGNQGVRRGGALLKGRLDGVGRLQLVYIDSDIFGDGRIGRLWLGPDGSDESFGQHG